MKWIVYIAIIAVLSSACFAVTCGENVLADLKMAEDINCRTNGLIVGNNEITIDCDNHTITGLNGFSGIEADGKKGLTIKNCRITGFVRGVYFKDTNDSAIESNELRENENGIELRGSRAIDVSGNGAFANNIGIVRYFYTNVTAFDNTLDLNTEDTYDFNEVIPQTEEGNASEEPEQEVKDTPLTAEELLNETIYLEYRLEGVDDELVRAKLDELGKTSKDLEIKREITYADNKTKVVLTIIPKKRFKNLDIYDKIPKCFAMYVDLVVFDKKPEVLASDPLIKWHFEELDVPTQLIYFTPGMMPAECDAFFQAIGLGEAVSQHRWWIAIIVLVVVAAFAIYFARYSKE
jgi:parallel beta-helix repeat protein